MPGPTIDFTQWLRRLGFKYDEQPAVIRTVQPVAIVADHRHLVSDPLLVRYLVGSRIVPVAAQFGCFLVKSADRPLNLRELLIASDVAGPVTLEIGTGAAPIVNNSTVLVPQIQAGVPTARYVAGDQAAAAGTGLPTLRMATQATFSVRSGIRIASGDWLLAKATSASPTTLFWAASVEELPPELPA